MRKPDKSAIMSVPVGPEVTTTPVQSGAGDSISDLTSRLAGAGKRVDAVSPAQEVPREVQMPFMPAPRPPEPVTAAPEAPVVSKKGQMSLAGDLQILDTLKSLSKSEKLTNAEMVGEMLAIYSKLKTLGQHQRYTAAEMLDVLIAK